MWIRVPPAIRHWSPLRALYVSRQTASQSVSLLVKLALNTVGCPGSAASLFPTHVLAPWQHMCRLGAMVHSRTVWQTCFWWAAARAAIVRVLGHGTADRGCTSSQQNLYHHRNKCALCTRILANGVFSLSITNTYLGLANAVMCCQSAGCCQQMCSMHQVQPSHYPGGSLFQADRVVFERRDTIAC